MSNIIYFDFRASSNLQKEAEEIAALFKEKRKNILAQIAKSKRERIYAEKREDVMNLIKADGCLITDYLRQIKLCKNDEQMKRILDKMKSDILFLRKEYFIYDSYC